MSSENYPHRVKCHKIIMIYPQIDINPIFELMFRPIIFIAFVCMLHFCRNGSVVVDFVVIYRKDGQDKRIVVSEKVKEEIVMSSTLGNYRVNRFIIRGKIIVFACLKKQSGRL